MECSRIRELFSEYLDEVLDDATRRTVEEHLAVCGSCAEELNELRSCLAALGSLDTVKAPRDFLEQVRERIERDERASFLGWLKAKLFFPLRVKLPLEVAGLAMAALLVVFIYHEVRQGTVPGRGYVPSQAPAPAPGAEILGRMAEMRAPSSDERSRPSVAPPPQNEAPAREAASSPAPGESAGSSRPATGAEALGRSAAETAAPKPTAEGVAASKPPALPAAPLARVLRDSGASRQAPEPDKPAKPMRLVLVLGGPQSAPLPLDEKDQRAVRRDQPSTAPVTPSTSMSEAPAPAPAPAPPTRALPRAAPQAEGRSAVASGDRAVNAAAGAGGVAGKDLAKRVGPADAEAERNSAEATARAGASRSSLDQAKPGGTPESRVATGSPRAPEPMSSVRSPEAPGAQRALTEIRSFVQRAGGRIEADHRGATTKQPQTLTVRIPAQSVPAFLELLGRLGQLRGAPEAGARTLGTEPILVQIAFELAP